MAPLASGENVRKNRRLRSTATKGREMDNTVGYVLLVGATVPFTAGVWLSLVGLRDAKSAANKVKAAAADVTRSVAVTTEAAAAGAPADAGQVAVAAADTATRLGDVHDELGSLNDALNGLTGPLAPARVAFALAAVLVVGALFA